VEIVILHLLFPSTYPIHSILYVNTHSNNYLSKPKEEFTTIYQQILAEKQRLEKEIQLLQQQIEAYPKGRLTHAKNGNYHRWYQNFDSKRVYLKKEDCQTREKLAIKKYFTCQLEDMFLQKKAVDSYLQCYHPNQCQAEPLLIDATHFRKLLPLHFQSVSDELSDWINASYPTNPNHPEQLIHHTLSGNVVRSKSESMIDMSLFLNKIPFRYECLLQLGDISFYPDFTIKHPKTGETFYWEHFGMMDNPAYSDKTYSKLKQYNDFGIVQSIHLITTYETKMHPLTPALISQIISQYFL